MRRLPLSRHFLFCNHPAWRMQRRQLCFFQLHPLHRRRYGVRTQNQEALRAALPAYPQELIIPFQTHSTDSLVIDETYQHATCSERHSMLQGIDALITDMPGYCICISTADCIPILLYDKQHRVVAAVHAGWRGTVNRILAKTLLRMQVLTARKEKTS